MKKRKRENIVEGPHHRQPTAPGHSMMSTEKGPIEYTYIGSDTEPTSEDRIVSKATGHT